MLNRLFKVQFSPWYGQNITPTVLNSGATSFTPVSASTFTITDSSGTTYSVSNLILDNLNASYLVPTTVSDSSGTDYTPT